MKTDSKIIEICKKRKAEAGGLLGKQRKNIRECQAFYAGDIADFEQEMRYTQRDGTTRKAMVQISRVKPYVNAVSGFMTQNRVKARYDAELEDNGAQQMYSGYTNGTADFVRNNADADQVESIQDKDMLIGGVAAIETCMTYGDGYISTDPNGEILFINLDMDTVFYDPKASAVNLIDARYCGYEKIYSLEDALDMFNKSDEDDFDSGSETEDGQSELKVDKKSGVNYREEPYDWADEEEKTVKVTFYQWFETEKLWRCENPQRNVVDPEMSTQIAFALDSVDVGDFESFDPQADIIVFDNAIKKQLDEVFGGSLDMFPVKQKVYYTAVLSGKTVFDAFRSPSQSSFSIQFKTGDRDKKNKIWTGMVNGMMQPTLYFCKALTEIIYIIASTAKGGNLYEKDVIEDIAEFERNFLKTNGNCEVAEGALNENRIQPKRQAAVPTGYEQVLQITEAALLDSVGFDKSFLSSADSGNETAALRRLKIRQVISSLASYFDSITLYKKKNARILLDFMRIYAENNPGAIIQIIGRDGMEEFVRLAQDMLMVKYGVTITEAPQTAEEKQEYAVSLLGIGDRLVAGGDVQTGKRVYAVSIKYQNLEAVDKRKMIEILDPPDGQKSDLAYVQQLEQQVQQLTSDMNKAQMALLVKQGNKLESDAALNTAKIGEVKAGAQQKAADTTKKLEEAEQINFETEFTKKNPKGVVPSINI